MTKDVVKSLYTDGKINSYMAERLMNALDYGVTDDLIADAVDDAQSASDAGVSSDDDYNVYFFIKTCIPDMLKDTFGINPQDCDQKDLCSYIMSHKADDGFNAKNLTDYRVLIHQWLCDALDKRAHPNISGKQDREPERDIDKWVSTLKEIYASVHSQKMSRDKAFDHFTSGWDVDEKQQFNNWMRYYESGTTEKYNVKNASNKLFVKEALMPEAWMSPQDRANQPANMTTYKPPEKSEKELRVERAALLKTQMKSRLRALRKLLDTFNDASPSQDLDAAYNEMNMLDRSISRLNVYASMQDVLIRSANKMKKIGFDEGAAFLIAIAEEDPAGAADVLPAPMSPEPDLEAGSRPQVNITMIINRLEGVSKQLKSRDTIRELASIDILLNEIGIASHFPELTDAQAKLIEAFGYASNKIESIVAKLRGSGASAPSPVMKKAPPQPKQPKQETPPQAPKLPVAPKQDLVNTQELHTKPMGEVQQELPTKG